MTNSHPETYQAWFQKADEDERSINAILSGDGSPSTVCFLAQQMAEKYLKGLLVFRQKSFSKVHDLLELETLLLEIQPNINTIHAQLELLNRYYIETRYPGDYPQFSLTEARQAYTAAQEVKNFVLQSV